MRVLDDKKRLFGIANPIDMLAVLTVLVAAFVAVNLLFGNPVAPSRDKKTVEVVIRVSEIRDFEVSMIKVGDSVVRQGGNMGLLGEVHAVRVTPSMRDVPTAKGTLNLGKSNLLKDLYVTVRGPGDIREDGSFLGAEKVRTNMEIEFQLPRFEASGQIVSLETVEE